MPLNSQDSAILESIGHALDRLLLGEIPESLNSADTGDEALRHACASLNRLVAAFADARNFLQALSQGHLDVDPPPRNLLISPFKQLQSNLKHLTWQTKEITKGDLNQHVDFLGEFSASFNEMIAALREKRRIEKQLEEANQLLEHQATTDPLTGLPNRLKFNMVLEQEMNRARRHGMPLALIMFDIDHFKQINDTYGHPAGDAVLKELGKNITPTLRREDVAARWGGEEFVVLLPHTMLDGAFSLASRLRVIIESHGFPAAGKVTCSFGTAFFRNPDSGESFLSRADEALYRAKEGGRNRVEQEVAQGSDHPAT